MGSVKKRYRFCYRFVIVFSVVTRKPLPGLNAPSHGCEQEGRKQD